MPGGLPVPYEQDNRVCSLLVITPPSLAPLPSGMVFLENSP